MQGIQAAGLAIATVAREVLARGGWLRSRETGELDRALEGDEHMLLGRWAEKVGSCGRTGFVAGCVTEGGCGEHRAIVTCCEQAPCPRHQRRQARRRQADARAVLEAHPGAAQGAGPRWRLITLSLRPRAGERFEEGVERAAELRRAAMRWSKAPRREAGKGRHKHSEAILGGWAALEIAGQAHVHVLCFGGHQVRSEWQRKLKGWAGDCDVPGCKHPADDRCATCQAAGRGCEHPHADGRARCSGSWVVDIRLVSCKVCRAMKRACVHGPVAREHALLEAMKYATKPVLAYYDPERGATAAELDHIERTLRAHLALRGRHRIESYGIAREGVAAAEEREREEEDGAGDGLPSWECRCGCRMVPVKGWRWDASSARLRALDPWACVREMGMARGRGGGPDG